MILDSGMAFSIRKYKLGKVRLILFSSFNKSSATFAKTVTSRSTVSGELRIAYYIRYSYSIPATAILDSIRSNYNLFLKRGLRFIF